MADDAALQRDEAAGESEPEPRPRRRRTVLAIAIAMAAVLGFLVIVFAVAKDSDGDTAETPLLGQAAPAISGRTLDGDTFDLSTRRGSWVVLNFFASWCDPCKQEAPELARFASEQQALGAGGAELVGVVYNDSEQAVRTFLDDYGSGFSPVVLDPDGGTAISYGVVKVPETWIVDPNGIVRARVITAVGADRLTELLRQAQGEGGGEP
jgi:cytochrome c biogenesis protein CcmG/thiol:disulfide interchange protein DsbE